MDWWFAGHMLVTFQNFNALFITKSKENLLSSHISQLSPIRTIADLLTPVLRCTNRVLRALAFMKIEIDAKTKKLLTCDLGAIKPQLSRLPPSLIIRFNLSRQMSQAHDNVY
jgi:hypothetical protein